MTAPGEAPAFDTLIYTDCVPGQGLTGAAGLQFQARSPAADREAMAVVQRSLLYEPPSAWMMERRPVEDYPPSFAHIHDGLYATASGAYLGREANGGREGNQLTHGIVTRNPESYGLIRPAQLFDAPFWTTRPAPTTACAPVAAGWEPGPFDAAAAQDFVQSQPHGEQRLVALVSALDRSGTPDGRRVLFIAEDAAEVLRWVAAATMLIPQRMALSIGVKVFTTNPAYAPQHVVAVHPGWSSTSATVDNDSGYVVFDLTTGNWSRVEESDQARRRVRLFLEHEPYDVLDIVEVAALLGLSPKESLDLGIAMVMPGERMTEPLARLAVRWLRDTDPELLAAYRGGLTDQLDEGTEQWPRDILVDLDHVAVSGQVPADRVVRVRQALIRAELKAVLRDPAATGVPLAPLPDEIWDSEAQRSAESLVLDVLGRGVAPTEFDAVLRAAKRLRVRVRLAEVAAAVDAFVVHWADHPRQPYAKAGWEDGDTLEKLLREELIRRIRAGDAERVGTAWWERLLPGLEAVETDLDRAVLAAAMRDGPPELRVTLIEGFIAGAGTTGRPELVASAARWLWAWTSPTADDLRLLCRLLPDGPALDGSLFEPLAGHLIGSHRLGSSLLELAHELVRHKLYEPMPDVAQMLAVDRKLRRLCRELPRHLDPKEFAAGVTLVKTADHRLQARWGEQIGEALVDVDAPKGVWQMLAALPESGRLAYVRLLLKVFGRPTVPHVVTGFYLLWTRVLDQASRDQLDDAVAAWIAGASGRRLKQVADAVDALGDQWSKRWAKTLKEAQARKRQGWLPWGRGGRD
ncbi:MAG TPA: GTPase-associated protein 1-related protein [Micromonosporaceae bacterium]|nr:GTPase-associated protein 1-related protein [Micromonosporaceae bacterium]